MADFKTMDPASSTVDSIRKLLGLPRVGAWSPADLASPPKAWFDAHVGAASLSKVSDGQVLSAWASTFNTGTYIGNPVTANITVQERNPHFGGTRTVFLSGAANTSVQLTGSGAATLLSSKPGCTLIWFGRWVDELPSPSGEGYYMTASTPTASTVRASLDRIPGAANSLRYGGRRLDANSFDSNDIVGNRGTAPQVIIATFNYAAGTKSLDINGFQVHHDATFQTAGNSDSTNTAFAGIGNYTASGGAPTKHEVAAWGIHDGVYTTDERQRIAAMLMHRAGLAELIHPDNAYKTDPP